MFLFQGLVTRKDQRPSWHWHHWHYLWHAYCIYQSNIYNTLIFIMQCSTLRGHPNTYLGDSWWSTLWHHMASLTCWSFPTYVQSSPPMTYHFTRRWSKRWCTFHPRYLNPRVLTNRSQTCWLHMVTKCMSCQIWLHMASFWVSMVDFQDW